MLTTQSHLKNSIIYVVENDKAARESLEFLLAEKGYNVSSHRSAECFLKALPLPNYQVLSCALLDVNLPDLSGIELQKKIIGTGVNIPISFISEFVEVSTAVQAMKQGAFDVLQKPIQDDILCKLIDEMLTKAKVDQELSTEANGMKALFKTLTSRELQILDLIVIGRCNREISADLEISIKTVEQHRANIMEKLKVKRPAGLLQFIYKYKGAKKSESSHTIN